MKKTQKNRHRVVKDKLAEIQVILDETAEILTRIKSSETSASISYVSVKQSEEIVPETDKIVFVEEDGDWDLL